MEEVSFVAFAEATLGEGEEHVTALLTSSSGDYDTQLLDKGQYTDTKVPGRLLGRHKEYLKIGAESYIV